MVVFLSYNSRDRERVDTIRHDLIARGAQTFIDHTDLTVGKPWQPELEQAVMESSAVVVFLGNHGLGRWQKRELWLALDVQAQREGEGTAFPVVPAFFPGADLGPSFLMQNTGVDLRDPADDGIERLIQTIRGTATPSIVKRSSVCPYRGLRAFRDEDQPFFFGREKYTNDVFNKVRTHSLVCVAGASGSGKSSIVRAGLIPLLARSRPPNPSWETVIFTPGERPFRRLATALVPLLEPELDEVEQRKRARSLDEHLQQDPGDLPDTVRRALERCQHTDRLLIVADQFEELFNLSPQDTQDAFANMLATAFDTHEITLLVTLHADFWGRTMQLSQKWSERFPPSLVYIHRMTNDELERAIVEPALAVGLDFDPTLPGRILDDVGSEPGSLPLLEFALEKLWAEREGNLITQECYESIGTVRRAVAQHAEGVFDSLTRDGQQIARKVLARLARVTPPGEGGCDTPRRATLAELGSESSSVVQRLVKARLLVTNNERQETAFGNGPDTIRENGTASTVVELAHEALIRSWDRLSRWLDEDREFLLWRQRLREVYTQWEQNGRDEGCLLRGTLLEEALRFRFDREDDLERDELEFIDTSCRRRDRTRRLRQLGTVAVLATLLMFALFFWWLWRDASNESRLSRDLLRISKAREHPELALYILREVEQPEDTPGWFRASINVHHRGVSLATLSGHKDVVESASFSPSGSRIVTASADGTVRVWNADGGRPTILQHEDRVRSAAFSPDGDRIVTGSADGTARVWNVDGSGTPVVLRHEKPVLSAAFSPDGDRIITTSADGTVRVWNADGGRPTILQHENRVRSAAFNPDGDRIVTASEDGTARVWNVDGSGTPIVLRHEKPVLSAAFSRDGDRIVTAPADGTARVWNADGSGNSVVLRDLDRIVSPDPVVLSHVVFSPEGSRVLAVASDHMARVWNANRSGYPTATMRHERAVFSAAFSPGGDRIVTASADRTARVWNADGSGTPIVLRGHGDAVESASFGPDGARVVTTSWDHTAEVWNVDSPWTPAVGFEHETHALSSAFSPGGDRIVTAFADGTARVWNADGSGTPVVLKDAPHRIELASFSPDGSRIVTVCRCGTFRAWNVDGSRTASVGTSKQLWRWSRLVSFFSPDGSRALTVSAPGTMLLWNASGSAAPVILGGHERKCDSVMLSISFFAAFSPNGSRVVTVHPGANSARVWNADGSGRPTVLQHENRVRSAAFSPEGDRIVTASEDGTARVWNADGSGTPIVLRHEKSVLSAAFSHDGGRVVTTSADRTARVWNADGPGSPTILLHESRVRSAAFNSDGNRIVTASEDGTARVWNADGSGTPIVLRHEKSVLSAAFSPDGDRVVTTSADRTARVWNADGSGNPTILLHENRVRSAAFSPDGDRIVTVSADGTARVWNADGSGNPTILLHENRVRSAAFDSAEDRKRKSRLISFSPDGSLIVMASSDGAILVWKADRSRAPVVLEGHERTVASAAFSPSGSRIVTASADGTARVWNADGSGAPVVLRHEKSVRSAAFSHDGGRIVTASADRTARVWNVDGSGNPIVFQHEERVVSAAFSAEGDRIVTVSADHTARIWNADGSGYPTTLQYGKPVWSAAFSPDGTRILTKLDGGLVLVWPSSSNGLLDLLWTASTYCLPIVDRMNLLGQTAANARADKFACEKRIQRPIGRIQRPVTPYNPSVYQ